MGPQVEYTLPPSEHGNGPGSAQAPKPVPLRHRLRSRVGVFAVLAVLVMVGAVLAGIGVTRDHRTARAAAPQSPQTPVAAAPQRPRPQVYPTMGELVPPLVTEPQTTPTPAPKTPKPKATPSRAGQRCPANWRRFPPLVEWCKRHGYRTD
jgi:hypothetical protein